MAMKNEVNAPMTLTIAAISVLLVLTAVLAVDGWYKTVEAEVVTAKWDQAPNTWLADIRQKQNENLHVEPYRIKSPNKRYERYHVSINEAMQIVAKNEGKLSQ